MRGTNPYLKLLTSSFAFFLWNVTGAQAPRVFALTGVTIIDATNEKPLVNETIIVKGQIIDDIFPTGSKRLADTIARFSLEGKYVVPGLIDTHVHLATDPSGVDTPSVIKRILQKMLYSGITSVRDMAGDARVLAGLSRDALVGDIIAPSIYYSALMAGPEFFKADERTVTSTRGAISGDVPYMRAITDSTNMTIVVAQAKGTGAKGIKLYASLSGSLVEKVVAEANKQEMMVWAHATLFPAKPLDVVQAGVNVISHADLLVFNSIGSLDGIPREWRKQQPKEFWDRAADSLNLDGLFELMKKKNTILDATLSADYRLVQKRPQLQMRYEFAKRIAAKAH
ncbi:MAG TPA: amidohydrolase family protein, partial [Chitinophagaceae bacterium]|nr:amidohydrolase family protein [Chitinophagaceae bacterium]